MQPNDSHMQQLQATLADVIRTTLAEFRRRVDTSGALPDDAAARFIADVTAVTLFELAESLERNADIPGAPSYRFAADKSHPADIISSISGWLSAPKDKNPISGKNEHPFPFDFYGEKTYD